jgi:hypothetical protein
MAHSLLAVDSATGGDSFLRGFSHALGGALPPLDVADDVGKLEFDAWLKGDNFKRVRPGEYTQGGGSWQRARLFLQHRGRVADILMAFDFESRAGEFIEFDSLHRDSVVMVLGSALRGAPFPHGGGIVDGKLSNRLINAGMNTPRIRDWRILWPRSGALPDDCGERPDAPECQVTVSDWGFCPGNQHGFFTEKIADGRSEIRRVAMSNPGYSRLMGRTNGRLWKIVCLDREGDQYLIVDIPGDRKVPNATVTSRHPRHVWLLNSRTNQMVRLRGPWDKHRPWVEKTYLSPDERFILIQAVHKHPDTRQPTFAWYSVHLETRSAVRFDLPISLHRFRGWSGLDSSLRAMFVSGGALARERQPYLVRPSNGVVRLVDRLPVPLVADRTVSPDGRWQYRIHRHGLEILDRSADRARIFRIPPSEKFMFRSGCCSWLGSDHLLITAPTLGVLSVDTLDYSQLPGSSRAKHVVEISEDSEWMLIMAGSELSIARIVIPMDEEP